ncbi:MAG: FAD:protein FMN transferase [Chlamydiales bacterium]
MRGFLYALVILFPTCYPKFPRLHHFSGIAMEMPYHVQVSGSLSRKKQAHIESIIASSFAFIHSCFDHWNPKSELSLINQLPVLEEKKLSPKLLELFAVADQVTKVSEGRFNPALGFIISLWKKSLEKSERIDQEMLESLRENLSWDAISLRNGVFCKQTEVQFDFDGIAKGFGIDLLVERLRFSGYTNVYVDWAGDIAVSGNHPKGRQWQIAIRNPISRMPDSEIIPLPNLAIATSGDYEQYWEIDSKQYSHIIHPDTLHPIEIKEGSIASVTVRAPSCAYADGLATSAMTFSNVENLLEWASKVQSTMPGVSFWIFQRHCSSGQLRVKKHKI